MVKVLIKGLYVNVFETTNITVITIIVVFIVEGPRVIRRPETLRTRVESNPAGGLTVRLTGTGSGVSDVFSDM